MLRAVTDPAVQTKIDFVEQAIASFPADRSQEYAGLIEYYTLKIKPVVADPAGVLNAEQLSNIDILHSKLLALGEAIEGEGEKGSKMIFKIVSLLGGFVLGAGATFFLSKRRRK